MLICRSLFRALLYLIWPLSVCCESTFDNAYNHRSGKPIEQLKVCGERCSGTHFVRYLLLSNFPSMTDAHWTELGHKHWLWWFGTPLDDTKLQKLGYSPNAVDMSDTDNHLFILVVRNPYDWVRSFYNTPHSVDSQLLGRGLMHFLSSEWKTSRYEGFYDEIDNWNPWTEKPFTNVLQLRSYKMKNYLLLGSIVKNYLFVRYEDVIADPVGFIDFVANYFDLEKKADFVPISLHLGTGKPFAKSTYIHFQPQEREFIDAHVDWTTEELLGYSKEE